MSEHYPPTTQHTPFEAINSQPETLSPEAAAQAAVTQHKRLVSQLPNEVEPYFVNPNIVLTLAGERGQTEDFFESPSSETYQALQNASQDQELLESGIRITPDPDFNPEAGDNLILNIESLDGYVEVSERTNIPGIEPFDPAEGWDGVDRWINSNWANIEQLQQSGEFNPSIEAGHVVLGVMKGYPDSAILGHLKHLDDETPTELSQIPYSDYYDCPQTNFSYPVELADEPDIINRQQRWGQVLERFYTSDYHQRLATDPDFTRHRSVIDNSL